MRKVAIAMLLAIAVLASAGEGDRLRLDEPGWSVLREGEAVVSVRADGADHAVLTTPGGEPVRLELPPLAPLDLLDPLPPVPPRRAPRFVSQDFTTFLDALTLLLGPDAATMGSEQGFAATVRLETAAGRVGHSAVTGVSRGSQFAEAALNARLAQLLARGALPPTNAGTTLCDLRLVVTPGQTPVLTVWLGDPYFQSAPTETPLTAGHFLWRELALPTAVANTAAAATYAADLERARMDLLARLDAPPDEPLFGAWRVDAGATWDAVQTALATAPAGESEPLHFLGALALAHLRRLDQASESVERIIAAGADAQLRGAARRLRGQWRHEPNGGRAGEPKPDETIRSRAELWARARMLFAAIAVPGGNFAALPTARIGPEGEREALALLDAATMLRQHGDNALAASVLGWHRAHFPRSVLTPAVMLGEVRAAWRADPETGLETARALVKTLGGDPVVWDAAARRSRWASWRPWVEARLPSRARARQHVARVIRRAEHGRYLAEQDQAALEAARGASAVILGEAGDQPAWGDLSAAGELARLAGRYPEARIFLANAVDHAPSEQQRQTAMERLAAVLEPDARAVAAAAEPYPSLAELFGDIFEP
jgi:hypothetical protein